MASLMIFVGMGRLLLGLLCRREALDVFCQGSGTNDRFGHAPWHLGEASGRPLFVEVGHHVATIHR